jgi:hypothetical protein
VAIIHYPIELEELDVDSEELESKLELKDDSEDKLEEEMTVSKLTFSYLFPLNINEISWTSIGIPESPANSIINLIPLEYNGIEYNS